MLRPFIIKVFVLGYFPIYGNIYNDIYIYIYIYIYIENIIFITYKKTYLN